MKHKSTVLLQYPNARIDTWHGKFRVAYHQRGRRPLVALSGFYHTPQEAWKQAALNITIRMQVEEAKHG